NLNDAAIRVRSCSRKGDIGRRCVSRTRLRYSQIDNRRLVGGFDDWNPVFGAKIHSEGALIGAGKAGAVKEQLSDVTFHFRDKIVPRADFQRGLAISGGDTHRSAAEGLAVQI